METKSSSLIVERVASETGLPLNSVHGTIALLEGGATVPFIARYRKEKTGNMDEVQVLRVQERLHYHHELEERRQTILNSIEQQGHLDEPLRARILACFHKQELEDLYLPFKPKRKTKASVAVAKGLEPLARFLWAQEPGAAGIDEPADGFVGEANGVPDREDALEGARHIMAEWVSDDATHRKYVRDMMLSDGLVVARAARPDHPERTKYEMYYDFKDPVATIPSHRMLAIRRGAKGGVLTFSIEMDDARAIDYLLSRIIRDPASPYAPHLDAAVRDSYSRLLNPSVQSDVRQLLKERSDQEAVRVFQQNLSNLLMQPPAGRMSVIGLDPGLRTGCKLAVVDETGKFLESATIYPLEPKQDVETSIAVLLAFIARHNVHAVAIGNGTGSREAEIFVRQALKESRLEKLFSVTVNEAGASVYSASEIAREEFPDLDLTIRGAISIARRLQDPLAELVKIDPRSLGVGQYQHDVDQKLLKSSLEQTVASCVNRVGVDVNTASAALLRHVSGINSRLAGNIVEYRDRNGRFAGRSMLRAVPGFGEKSFEQAAGFLRVRDGEHPLDATAVHPESYEVVARMAEAAGVPLNELIGNGGLVEGLDLGHFQSEAAGAYTLADIRDELLRPGRDPRQQFEAPQFREDVLDINDLKEGMVLEGTISNVANFGAFVDIGVHQDGLVHISQLSNRFVRDASQVVKVGDIVKVKVLAVDAGQKRISLSIKALLPPAPAGQERKNGDRSRRRPGGANTGTRREAQRRGPDRPRQDRPRQDRRGQDGRRPQAKGRDRNRGEQPPDPGQPRSRRQPDMTMEERIAQLQAKFRPLR